jgi:hypothetical protein
MGHWFDDLSRELARGKVSRRALLHAAMGAGLVKPLDEALSASSAPAARVPAQQVPIEQALGLCTVRQQQVRTFSLSTQLEWQGRPLQYEHTTSVVVPAGDVTIHKAITLGGETLFASAATRRPSGAVSASIRFGAALAGAREATFTSDGKLFAGKIDGREVLAFSAGADYRSLRFSDGQDPPSGDVPNELKRAIQTILKQASAEARSCLPAKPGPVADQSHSYAIRPARYDGMPDITRPAAGPFVGDAEPAPVQHGDHGHGSHPSWSEDCKGCEAICVGGGIACGLVCAGSCVTATIFYAVCVIACELGCLTTELACMAICHSCGQPCCPVCCGNVACCDRGESCLNPSTGVCCSVGLQPCANHSCCQPTATCIPSDGTCCPAGQVVCSNVCCKPGELCKEGICCPKDQILCANVCCGPREKCVNGRCCPSELACGNVCCDELTRCVNPGTGLCCSFASVTCGAACCPPGHRCLEGQCCPPNQVCGRTCCPPGFPCQNPAAGICSPVPCPDQQKACNPEPGGPGICCPTNVGSCCNGQCCQPNEICCSRTGLPFGCHHPALCVA